MSVQINETYQVLDGMDVRYLVIYGGRRSSKSWSVSQLLAKKALQYPGRKFVVMRKVARTIKLSVWERMKNALDEFGVLKYCNINKSDREIHLPNKSTFYFVGADDPEKLKSIEGVTDYWLEEATEFTEQDFDTLDAGLSPRVTPSAQIWLTFNPIPSIPGWQHWIQARWFSGKQPELGKLTFVDTDTVILRTYFRHNAFCPQATIRVLEKFKTTNPDLWLMWGLGIFAKMKGAILDRWDNVTKVPAEAKHLGFGLDFGFALDPCAIVEVWVAPGHLWAREWLYATELTNPKLDVVMEADLAIERGVSDIKADSAEPKSIQELQDLGWLVTGCFKYPGMKREAAMWLKGTFLHVVGDSPNLSREAATWHWKRQKAADEDTEEVKLLPVPADGNDHLIDAIIYRAFERQEDIVTKVDVEGSHSDDVPALDQSIVDEEVQTVLEGIDG